MERFLLFLSFCAFASAIIGPAGNSTKAAADKTDSYLEAYSKSRVEAEKAKKGVIIVTAKDGEKKISNRDDSFSGYDYTPSYSDSPSFSSGSSGFSAPNSHTPATSYGNPVKFEPEITYNSPPNTYGPPSNTYGPPSNTYGPPSNTYGPPSNTYAPPSSSYGPPAQNYGPPSNTYGPPSNTYGPPAQTYGPPVKPVYGPPKPTYGVPYSTAPSFPGLGFLDKLAWKLDILTAAKLMLKLFIFKKLVTMLAVVCMLLVIPKIVSWKKEATGNSNDEEERTMKPITLAEMVSVRKLVARAFAVYGAQPQSCDLQCRLGRVYSDLTSYSPYHAQEKSTTKST